MEWYFNSAEIEDDLKCVFCKKQFRDVVKLLPDCGESICGECYVELRKNKSLKVKCPSCKGKHAMPESGFTDNKSIARLIKRRRIEKPLSEQARALKEHIESIRSLLGGLETFDAARHVNDYCDQLAVEVRESVDATMKKLRSVEEDLLRVVGEYRSRCLEDLATGGKLKQVLKPLADEVGAFTSEWSGKMLSMLDAAEIEVAIGRAANLKAKIGSFEGKLKAQAFNGKVMAFKAHNPLMEDRDPLTERFCLFARDYDKKELTIRPALSHTLNGHTEAIRQVVFAPGGKLASCSDDGSIKIWDVASGRELATLVGHSDCVNTLAVLSNGWLASGSDDKTVIVWNLESGGKTEKRFEAHANSVVSLRALKKPGQLASYSIDDTIKVWNVLAKDAGSPLLTIARHHNIEWLIPFGVLSNGSFVTCSRDEDQAEKCDVSVWSAEDGKLTRTVSSGLSAVRTMLVLGGDQLALGFDSGTIKILDLASTKPALEVRAYSGEVMALLQLPNGDLLSSGYDYYGFRTLKLWNTPDLSLLQIIGTDHVDAIGSLSLSADEKMLASGCSDKTVKLWTISTTAN